MSNRLLTTADIHLGNKSSSISEDLEESSTKFTWQRMVTWAIEHTVDTVVLAGDIIDRDNRFFEAIGPIQKGFERLGEAGIQVVMVSGNHDFDVLPDIIKNKKYDHVHLLGQNGKWESVTIQNDKGNLQLVGWSFPNQYVREDPLIQLKTAELDLDPNIPTIGILHGELFNQNSRYAPIEISNLTTDSVDAWVLGHIHKPQIQSVNNPLIFYSGSPHALSSKEPGAHGPFLLTVESRDNITTEQISLSPIRYEMLEIDISDVNDESEFRNLVTRVMSDDVQNKVEELEPVTRIVYDIVLTGENAILSEIDNWSQQVDQFEQEMLPEKVVTIRVIENQADARVENLEELAGQPTPPGILAKAILDIKTGKHSEFLDDLITRFKNNLNNVNASKTYQPLRTYEELYSGSVDDAQEFLMRECQQLLGELLLQKEES